MADLTRADGSHEVGEVSEVCLRTEGAAATIREGREAPGFVIVTEPVGEDVALDLQWHREGPTIRVQVVAGKAS